MTDEPSFASKTIAAAKSPEVPKVKALLPLHMAPVLPTFWTRLDPDGTTP